MFYFITNIFGMSCMMKKKHLWVKWNAIKLDKQFRHTYLVREEEL